MRSRMSIHLTGEESLCCATLAVEQIDIVD
jgi:hypothetical protein